MERIVVGYDGSPASRAAAAVAVDEARRRGADVEAVYAWSPLQRNHRQPDADGGFPAVAPDESEVARAWVADGLAGLGPSGAAAPTVRVRVEESDLPARAVLDAAVGALLVVVGSRGRHGVRGDVLGSTSQRILADAPCPVLVVPRAAVDAVLARVSVDDGGAPRR